MIKKITQALFCLYLICQQAVLAESVPRSDAAEALYAKYKQAVLQVRIIDKTSQSKSVIGSGFFISRDGYVISNFHVISDWIYKPERYEIRYLLNNKEEGRLDPVGIDIVHDLALLKADRNSDVWFKLLDRDLIQGEHLYSFGNPHDIGFSIVEGTYNGYLEKSLYKKIHFTGSVNPGMSGGPVVTRQGRVAGVNVSGAGNQLSFLVPSEYVRHLIESSMAPKGKQSFLAMIRDQLLSNQDGYMGELLKRSFNLIALNGYTLPGKLAEFMKCWGGTEKKEKMLYEQTYQICRTEDDIYLSPGQRTGVIEYEHDLYRNGGLGTVRFFALMEEIVNQPKVAGFADEEMVTDYECQTGQVKHEGVKSKLVFCLRGYRKFAGLYDAWMTAVVLADKEEVLQTTVSLLGVSYENAIRFSKAWMERVRWNP